MVYIHWLHPVPFACECSFYLCCESCCGGFKALFVFFCLPCVSMVSGGFAECTSWANGCLSFICNPLGILPYAAISFSLVKARWFNLMCHFNMFLLISLVLSSSSCLGSTLVDVSKLYGVMGSILFLPSFISVGCLCLSLQIQVFVSADSGFCH